MKANCAAIFIAVVCAIFFCSCATAPNGDNNNTEPDGDAVTADGDIDGETSWSDTDLDGIGQGDAEISESSEKTPEDDAGTETDGDTDDSDNNTEADSATPEEDAEPDWSDGDDIQPPDGDYDDDSALSGEILPCQASSGSDKVLLLKGTVVTPTQAWLNGEVLTDSISGEILCAAEDCSGNAQYQDASVICAEGVIMPAMLDPHNHSAYNAIPRWKHQGDGHCWQDGTHCQRLDGLYRNRYKWVDDPDYDETLKVNYNTLKTDHHCAMQKWAEIRMMMHGTSGVAGSYNTSICHCHLNNDLMMVRNLDQPRTCSGLDSDSMRSSISSPCDLSWSSYYSGVCDAFASGSANVIFLHVAEGVVEEKSRAEFYCLLNPKQSEASKTFMLEEIIGIHSTAAYSAEAQLLACTGMQPDSDDTYKIVWSPRSNIDLYGQTTNIPLALRLGIRVAIGPDWTPSGSLSQLQEMRCARYVSDRYWNGQLEDRTLVRMTTDLAARVMKIEDRLGRLEAGHLADVTVISANEDGRRHPYRSILEAEAWDVRLLLIGGRPMYGDSGIAPYNSLCETLNVCGHEKTVCVKKSSNPADADKGFTQTLTDISDELTDALQPLKEAASGEDKYMFELMPLVYCPGTPEYEADQPEETCAFRHNPHADVLFPAVPTTSVANDSDEDGLPDAEDNCPLINNADQMDRDSNGIGDACESYSFDQPPSQECPCTVSDCNRTECYGQKMPYSDKRWKAKACYPGNNPENYAKLVEIGDLWQPNSRFGADSGDAVQIAGAVVTATLAGGYFICDRDRISAHSALWIEDSSPAVAVKVGAEIDLIGFFERTNGVPTIKAVHLEPADSHRISAETEDLRAAELQTGENLADFIGMKVKISPAAGGDIRLKPNGLNSGILLETAEGAYELVPFVPQMQ